MYWYVTLKIYANYGYISPLNSVSPYYTYSYLHTVVIYNNFQIILTVVKLF